jgi:hypothetical protein
VNFNIRNFLPKFGTFLLGHSVYEINSSPNVDRMLSNGEIILAVTDGTIADICDRTAGKPDTA